MFIDLDIDSRVYICQSNLERNGSNFNFTLSIFYSINNKQINLMLVNLVLDHVFPG